MRKYIAFGNNNRKAFQQKWSYVCLKDKPYTNRSRVYLYLSYLSYSYIEQYLLICVDLHAGDYCSLTNKKKRPFSSKFSLTFEFESNGMARFHRLHEAT